MKSEKIFSRILRRNSDKCFDRKSTNFEIEFQQFSGWHFNELRNGVPTKSDIKPKPKLQRTPTPNHNDMQNRILTSYKTKFQRISTPFETKFRQISIRNSNEKSETKFSRILRRNSDKCFNRKSTNFEIELKRFSGQN